MIEIFTGEMVNYYDLIRSTRELTYHKRDQVKDRYYFSDGSLLGKGVLRQTVKIPVPGSISILPEM